MNQLDITNYVPDKAAVFRMFDLNIPPSEISDKYPELNRSTVRVWYSRYKELKRVTETIETTETVVTTVSKSVSNVSEVFQEDETFETESETSVSNATLFATPSSVANETPETFQLKQVETRVSFLETLSVTNVKSLIPIVLLGLLVVAMKVFVVTEVSLFLKQLTSVSTATVTVFATVTIFAPLVCFANISYETTGYIMTVIVMTILFQIFCCGVTVAQQIESNVNLSATLLKYTFFNKLWFSWIYAIFRGGVDLLLEYVLLETIMNRND